jgi:hypothetical protein
MTYATHLHAIVLREGDVWVAQCLEYDIGAQAADLESLRQRLAAAIGHAATESIARCGMAFADIEPAPPYYHDLWSQRPLPFTGQITCRHPEIVKPMTVDMALSA